jgi:hypothetical protein
LPSAFPNTIKAATVLAIVPSEEIQRDQVTVPDSVPPLGVVEMVPQHAVELEQVPETESRFRAKRRPDKSRG